MGFVMDGLETEAYDRQILGQAAAVAHRVVLSALARRGWREWAPVLALASLSEFGAQVVVSKSLDAASRAGGAGGGVIALIAVAVVGFGVVEWLFNYSALLPLQQGGGRHDLSPALRGFFQVGAPRPLLLRRALLGEGRVEDHHGHGRLRQRHRPHGGLPLPGSPHRRVPRLPDTPEPPPHPHSRGDGSRRDRRRPRASGASRAS